MPGLVRKLVIIAAVDGLILQPSGNNSRNGGGGSTNSSSSSSNSNSNSNGIPPLRIAYKTQKITSLSQTQANSTWEQSPSLEAHGLVGLLNIASYSFLISITQREQVAQILGKPVYAVTNVAVIPLSSQADASHAIQQAQKNLARRDKVPEADDISSSEAEADSDTCEDVAVPTPASVDTPGHDIEEPATQSSVAQDVIGNRGRYGRFSLNNWFMRKRWGPVGPILPKPKETETIDEESKAEDAPRIMPVSAIPTEPAEPEGTDVMDQALDDADAREEEEITPPNRAIDLLPKLLRYTKLIFSSSNFFFSYDYDLTRRYSIQNARNAQLPPHGLADPLYFWNKHLAQPLIDSGNDSDPFVLPLIQGFVGQREFTVASVKTQTEDASSPAKAVVEPGTGDEEERSPETNDRDEKDFLLTLISRRSTQRPGLRYLRRGVDDEGNTANTVETEQILSTPTWESSRNAYSLLQVRGSIPLYFSQSPYSLKPTPVLHHSNETNQIAFGRHFRDFNRKYGKVQIVSLLDKHGVEIKLGEAYEAYTRAFNEEQRLDGSTLGFEWFDFHHECRGMKFENVRGVVNKLEKTLEDFGETVIQDNTVLKEQSGIVRTNCMDCLDRTGVTQCAFGQRALEEQLKREGYTIDLRGDSSTQWFNILWADNGDSISKQYSSTAALKGDYTRTRKRNYRGALNDFGLTLSRYYNNLVSDYFSQACVDYLLGNVSMQVFSEFQDHLQTIDPGISASKLRQNAIDTCSRLVVDDQKEELLGGWAMLSPRQSNTLRTLPFEETILLLTDAAIYSCRLDWNVDKVLSFERVDLRSISRIRYGTYITSVLTDAQANEQRNVGVVIVYRDGDANALRVNTRSLQSIFTQDAQENTEKTREEWDLSSWLTGSKRATSRFMAFKALPVSTSARSSTNLSRGGASISEIAAVRSVCQEIERALKSGGDQGGGDVVEESEIISLAEAKKRTGYLEQLVYDVKKLVWA